MIARKKNAEGGAEEAATPKRKTRRKRKKKAAEGAPEASEEVSAVADPEADSASEETTANDVVPDDSDATSQEAEVSAENQGGDPNAAGDGSAEEGGEEEETVPLEGDRLRSCVEAILFASPEPLTRRRLRRMLKEVPRKQVDDAVLELEADLISAARGFRLVEDAAGLRLLSCSDFAPYVARLRGEKRSIRLSQAAFETLAVVAYRQPIGRADLDSIRGVQSGAVVKRLQEWNLVHIVDRDETKLGRPHRYGTTKLFLEQFGLPSLDDLPALDRFLEFGAEQGVQVDDEADQAVAAAADETSVESQEASADADSTAQDPQADAPESDLADAAAEGMEASPEQAEVPSEDAVPVAAAESTPDDSDEPEATLERSP